MYTHLILDMSDPRREYVLKNGKTDFICESGWTVLHNYVNGIQYLSQNNTLMHNMTFERYP